MKISNFFELVVAWLKLAFSMSCEYLLLTGIVFAFFYVLKKKKFWYFKIQQRFPGKQHIFREIKYSFFTVIIFGIVIVQVMWASKNHLTLIYHPIDKYGYPYFFFSILLMIFLHDAYFYWTHRLLHWKPLFKTVHKVHHLSINPTPFSAYAFHPVEALFEISILPLIVFTIPYHEYALWAFSFYTLFLNILGHMGYEFFPKGFTRDKILKWHNTATNHNMHHRFVKYNYGLYFNIWDRVMKTNHPKYEDYYDKVIEQRETNKSANKKKWPSLRKKRVSIGRAPLVNNFN